MTEIWMPVDGYEGLYEISNKGIIMSCEKRRGTNYSILIPASIKRYSNNGNYNIVHLSKNSIKKTRFVHRLVAKHFVPNPLNLPEVNHIDGNKLNCEASNLQWSTRVDNEKHAYANGLKQRGSMWGNSKAVLQYTLGGVFIKEWECLKDIFRALGFDRRVISRCCDGKTTQSHGYIWKYK